MMNSSILQNPVMKYSIRVVLAYVALLVLILATAILAIFVTFTFVVIDTITHSDTLGVFAETYFVPVSEFLWSLFLKLVPFV